jgi:non-haem Fe2+, alpha-ketoglutarate-dependent halogenase
MTRALNLERIEQYERDGVVFPIRVISESDAADYRLLFEKLEPLADGLIKRLDNAHLFFPWAYRLATRRDVVDSVESILGGDILIDGTLILCKYPHDPTYVSWHQDSVYSNWHLSPTVSAWIALSPSTSQSGCMRVIVGSHKQGLLDHDETLDPHNLLRRGERIAVDVDERAAVDLELRPGEMSLHHCNIIHGSNPNRSGAKRIGFIVRFVTNRIDRKGKPLVRVRGSGDCRHLELASEPAETDFATAFARWQEFARQRSPS